MSGLPFVKMHGLGNDFVVLDGRARSLPLSDTSIRAISNRRTGIGCDQFIVIEPARSEDTDAFMRIFNADGGEVEACGNATRCVAALLMRETGKNNSDIETGVGILRAKWGDDQRSLVSVDMGAVRLEWQDIPLARNEDTLHLSASEGALSDGVGVNVGNPHAVYFVDDVAAIDLETVGPVLEHHPLFPKRINVEAVQILSPTRLRMRVWERGVGITQACGTGACASLVAAARRGLCERKAEVVLDGGPLVIEWLENGHVLMSGPAATSFVGELDPSVLP